MSAALTNNYVLAFLILMVALLVPAVFVIEAQEADEDSRQAPTEDTTHIRRRP